MSKAYVVAPTDVKNTALFLVVIRNVVCHCVEFKPVHVVVDSVHAVPKLAEFPKLYFGSHPRRHCCVDTL